MAKQSKQFWLVRDYGGDEPEEIIDVEVFGGRAKPKPDGSGVFLNSDVALCAGSFERVTGLRLKPGQVVRARIVIKD